ncbi:MAG: hypothetical protein ACON5A_01630, partial [Candidatus Comchoanobacterales bacterium]
MIKRVGLALMLISSVMISAKDCKYEDINNKSDVHEWSIPKDCISLDLSESDIDDEDAKKLATAMKENKNIKLTNLILANNNIGYKGVKELAAVLNKNKTLTQLDLTNNNIGDKGVKELAAALNKNKTLTSLNLFYSQIRDEGAKELAAALNKNKTLTWLNFRANEIGYLGAKELA